jgi:protoporphyrinogen/coproporphyrinogen III oxidase
VTSRRVVVVGGGIAGLAAAHRLVEHARAGADLDVVLLEGTARLGGTRGDSPCASGSASRAG